EVLDVAPVLRLAFAPEARIADRRREQLELELELARSGLRGELESLRIRVECEADRVAGEDRLQLVERMLAEAAERERAVHCGGERVLAGVEHLPAVDVELDRDAVALQV